MNEEIINLLKSKKESIAVAESLTGGLLASSFVDISGASDVFKGGVVAYMLDIKESLLEVPLSHTIKTDGVDVDTAKMMAKNVCLKLNSDYGLSTTGIAEAWDERIEQAFICFYDRKTDKYHFEHLLFEPHIDDKHYITRDLVREETCQAALSLCLEELKKI